MHYTTLDLRIHGKCVMHATNKIANTCTITIMCKTTIVFVIVNVASIHCFDIYRLGDRKYISLPVTVL